MFDTSIFNAIRQVGTVNDMVTAYHTFSTARKKHLTQYPDVPQYASMNNLSSKFHPEKLHRNLTALCGVFFSN